MPKQKTKKAVVKRFRKTASGKIKFSSPGKSHLNLNKTRKRKRKLRTDSTLAEPEAKRIRHSLP